MGMGILLLDKVSILLLPVLVLLLLLLVPEAVNKTLVIAVLLLPVAVLLLLVLPAVKQNTSAAVQKQRLATLLVKEPTTLNQRLTKDLLLSDVMFFNLCDNPTPKYNKLTIFTETKLYTV